MPANKYESGKVYALRSHKTDKIYVGSTCQTLSKRFYDHTCRSNKNHTSAREILQYDDAYIELLENFPCTCKDELEKRQGEYIREFKDKAVNILRDLGKNVIDCPCGDKVLKWALGFHASSVKHMTWYLKQKKTKK
jgi:GIY-YIG catalytic domain